MSNGIPRVARFEKVSIGQFREAAHKALPGLSDTDIDAAYAGITLPCRATAGSSGYDIRTPFTFTLKSKFYTRLANTVGNIDSDYYGADNEGHIMVKLRMETAGGEPRTFEAGTAVCQGVFVPFGITEDDGAAEKRTGGFGSTGK